MHPCPFCHSKNITVEYKPSAWDSSNEELHVVCNECAASAPVYIWELSVEECSQARTKASIE